jgi:hypothetical protein
MYGHPGGDCDWFPSTLPKRWECCKSAPGFVAGHWVDPVDSQGFGFLLFETEKQAIAATPPKAKWAAPGVTILRTDVRRVAVSVP